MPKGQTDCDGNINDNAGCGITDWSKVSYGETFDAQGGGIYAMLWDETGIAVCRLFSYRFTGDLGGDTSLKGISTVYLSHRTLWLDPQNQLHGQRPPHR